MTHLPDEPMKEEKELDVIPEPNNLGEEARQLDAAPSEMVERVARAICASFGDDPNGPVPNEPDAKWWIAWTDEARAAIEVMREPSEAMLNAEGEGFNGPESLNGYLDNIDAKGVWQAMIDAALSDPNQIRKAGRG